VERIVLGGPPPGERRPQRRPHTRLLKQCVGADDEIAGHAHAEFRGGRTDPRQVAEEARTQRTRSRSRSAAVIARASAPSGSHDAQATPGDPSPPAFHQFDPSVHTGLNGNFHGDTPGISKARRDTVTPLDFHT
jgi:hypothetical protein